MPLVYRTTGNASDLPPWLLAFAGKLQRCDEFAGFWDPIIWRPDAPECQSATWHPVAKEWEVALIGEFNPLDILTTGEGAPMLLPVSDGAGRDWHAPAILSPDGACVIVRPLAINDAGAWYRKATPAQAAWIQAAESARSDALTMGPDGKPLLTSIDLSVAAGWAATLLGAIYPLNAQAFGRLGLLTDQLIREVLLASAGLRKP